MVDAYILAIDLAKAFLSQAGPVYVMTTLRSVRSIHQEMVS
jgi:hypothetical protein